MRTTQHQGRSPRMSRAFAAGGVLILALTIAGCSAVNMTGFEMPVFGLTKKSAEESDSLSTSSIPGEEGEAAGTPQGLADQY